MSSHGVPRSERQRSPEELRKDAEKISKYRALEDHFRQQTLQQCFDSVTFDLTTKLLRINPEYYTVWNVRRRCLISGPLRGQPINDMNHPAVSSPVSRVQDHEGENIPTAAGHSLIATDSRRQFENETCARETANVVKDELSFTVPLLMAHPKCYWIWNYRMWILEQAILLLPVIVSKEIWREELGLISKMLTRDRRNYHAWAYRRYVVAHLESERLQGQSMTEAEFAYTTTMAEKDLSNFSAWHNRAQLIPKLLSERRADSAARRAFLEQELNTVDNGLNVGPEDQSLWYYHQYLIFNVAEQPDEKAIVSDMSVNDQVAIIAREIDFIKDLQQDYQDVKWIFERLLEYTLLIHKLQNRPLQANEKTELQGWVAVVKKLDRQRSKRWEELAAELHCAI